MQIKVEKEDYFNKLSKKIDGLLSDMPDFALTYFLKGMSLYFLVKRKKNINLLIR